MLYLSATTAPPVKDIGVTGFSISLITVSLRDKGSMDRTNGFTFVNVLCEEHNNQSTTRGARQTDKNPIYAFWYC